MVTSIWSVSSQQIIQSWQQSIPYSDSGALTFFDGSRGLVEVQGSSEGINLVTTIDLYRVRNHDIIGQYTLRPTSASDSDVEGTALDVFSGVLVAIEGIGQREGQQGLENAYAYYALPLPVLN